MLCARLFGALSLKVDHHPVPEIAGLRPRSVLAWLLLHPGAHARADVAARFWPDVLDTSARASLRSALWTIRMALQRAGGAEYLVAGRDSVGISRELPSRIDAEEFQRLSASDDPRDLERALDLANKKLLTDLADDWVLEARDEFSQRAAAAALRLADEAEAAGDLRRAVSLTQRALVHDRLSEATHHLLARRLADAGEPAKALAVLRRFETVVATEFGTKPSADTRALGARLRAAPQSKASPVAPGPGLGASDLPLFGREQELASLVSAWGEAQRGSAGVALITGAAGIGKSRLASELAKVAAASGATIVTGVASGLDGTPPLSLWVSPVSGLVESAAPPHTEVAWPADLARLCPAVESHWGRPGGAPPTDPGMARTRLFESVVGVVEWSAATAPVLMLLEDLHLADSASLALLPHLGGRLGGTRALLVGTARHGGWEELATVLGALERGGGLATKLPLGPLARADIEAMVEATAPTMSTEIRAQVVAAADGSPLLARAGARAASTGADPAEGLRAWTGRTRATLGPAARQFVDLLAAAARPLALGEVMELVGPDRLPEALDEARAAGLVACGTGADPFRGGHHTRRGGRRRGTASD